MSEPSRTRLTRTRMVLLLVAALLVVAGAATAVTAAVRTPGRADASAFPTAAPQRSTPPSSSPPSSSPLKGPQPLPSSSTVRPVSVRIPAIKVSTTLQRLHLGSAGELDPPTDFVHAGWYAGGPVPGQPGPAVIAGHIDNYRGPAVFFSLNKLTAGDQVSVTLSNNTTVRFTVRSVHLYPKGDFPDRAVYGATPDAQLRLITCGGDFDYSKRSYRDNTVVYATRS